MMKKLIATSLFSLFLCAADVCASENASLSEQQWIEKGEQVAIASDCQACHTKPEGGKPFTGGYGISSPMGMIYPPISPHPLLTGLASTVKQSLLVLFAMAFVLMAAISIRLCLIPLTPS